MKNMKKVLLSMFVVLGLVFVMPVVIPELQSGYTVQAATIKLNKTDLKLNVNETYTLKLSGTSKTVRWTSSNKNIATVTSNGKITPKKAGNVYIRAWVDEKPYACKLKVEAPKLNVTSTTISMGAPYILRISGSTRGVTWTSSNKNIATVNNKGKVTPKKTGTVKITAKVGNSKYTCTVKVVKADKKKNIKVTSEVVGNRVLLTLKNNNNCQIDFAAFEVNFYRNNKAVDYAYTNAVCLPKNGTVYDIAFVPYDKNTNKPISFTSVDVSVTDACVYNSDYKYKNLRNNVTKKQSLSNNKITGTLKNNSKTTIEDAEVVALFYKGGKLVGCEFDFVYDIKANKTGKFEMYVPYDSAKKDYIKYDSYKVILTRATDK